MCIRTHARILYLLKRETFQVGPLYKNPPPPPISAFLIYLDADYAPLDMSRIDFGLRIGIPPSYRLDRCDLRIDRKTHHEFSALLSRQRSCGVYRLDFSSALSLARSRAIAPCLEWPIVRRPARDARNFSPVARTLSQENTRARARRSRPRYRQRLE